MNQDGKELIRTIELNPDAYPSLWLISGRYFIVSKAIANDHGDWETLVFPSNKEGKIESWLEVYSMKGDEPIVKTVEDFAIKGECKWD